MRWCPPHRVPCLPHAAAHGAPWPPVGPYCRPSRRQTGPYTQTRVRQEGPADPNRSGGRMREGFIPSPAPRLKTLGSEGYRASPHRRCGGAGEEPEATPPAHGGAGPGAPQLGELRRCNNRQPLCGCAIATCATTKVAHASKSLICKAEYVGVRINDAYTLQMSAGITDPCTCQCEPEARLRTCVYAHAHACAQQARSARVPGWFFGSSFGGSLRLPPLSDPRTRC